MRSDAKRRRGLLIGGVAAAVLVTAGVGAALALGGGDAGGADAGGGNGCPTSGPFVCITSTNVTNGGVVAEFQLADVDLDRTDLRFFLDTNPDAFVSWSVTDPFRSDIGDVTSGVRLCAVVNDSSGSAIAGSGNCVALDV